MDIELKMKVFLYFFLYFVLLLLLSIPRWRKRKKLIDSLDIMEDPDFVREMEKRFYVPEEYIISKRRELGKKLRIPYQKLSPGFEIANLKDSWVFSSVWEKSIFLLESLIEDLYYYENSPFYKEKLFIATVEEFIYYSAINEGALMVFR